MTERVMPTRSAILEATSSPSVAVQFVKDVLHRLQLGVGERGQRDLHGGLLPGLLLQLAGMGPQDLHAGDRGGQLTQDQVLIGEACSLTSTRVPSRSPPPLTGTMVTRPPRILTSRPPAGR